MQKLTYLNFVIFNKVMIDDMEGKMDQIHERLVKETKRVRFIDRKSSTCGKKKLNLYCLREFRSFSVLNTIFIKLI